MSNKKDEDFHKSCHPFFEGDEKACTVCKAKRCIEYLQTGEWR